MGVKQGIPVGPIGQCLKNKESREMDERRRKHSVTTVLKFLKLFCWMSDVLVSGENKGWEMHPQNGLL